MLALPTPGRLCSRAFTRRSAMSESCIRSKFGLLNANQKNGCASACCFAITGSSTSTGSRPGTRDTLSRASWAATSTGRSRLNSRMIWLFSSAEELDSVRSPWIVDSSSSSTSVTAVSTTCALAPGRVVETEMIGGSMSGSSRTDSRVYPMTPNSTRAALIILASTGRPMATSESFMPQRLSQAIVQESRRPGRPTGYDPRFYYVTNEASEKRHGARPQRVLDAAAPPPPHTGGDHPGDAGTAAGPRVQDPGAQARGRGRYRIAQQHRNRRRLGGRPRRGGDLRRRAGSVLPHGGTGRERHRGQDRGDRRAHLGPAAAVWSDLQCLVAAVRLRCPVGIGRRRPGSAAGR